MVIKVQIQNWDVKHILVDPGSSANVIYWEAFKGMNFDVTELLPFTSSLVGFSGEPTHVLGHLPMITTFGNGESEKSVLVKYLIVNATSPFNIIIGKSSFNALEATLSTLYLTLKYPLKDGRIGIIKRDQEITRKCYKNRLKLKKKILFADESVKDVQVKVNSIELTRGNIR